MKTPITTGKIPRLHVLLPAIALAMAAAATADVDTTGLDRTRDFSDSGVDYRITYSDTSGDNDRVSTSDVDNLEEFAKTSWDSIVDTMGFPAPWLSTLPDFQFIVKDDWWYAEPACVVLDAPSIRSWPADDSRVVFFHERFHTVQRNYKDQINGGSSGYIGSTFGKWVSEGNADAMMDKGYADLDDKLGYPYYEGSAVNFLNSPGETLFDKEYDCCLWWNYCMEQLGTNHVEPQYGTEFMKSYWNRLVANGNTGSANSKLTLEQAIAARGTNLQTVFHNFTICNYTREFSLAGIPNYLKYRYVDEQTQPISTMVPRTAASMPGSGTISVNPWSAKYLETTLKETGNCFAAGFRGVSSGDSMAFSVVATDREGKVIGIKKGIGTDFAGVFFSEPGRPINKICGIAGGLEEGGSVDWDFDSGMPTVAIERPTFTRPAYPGPHASPGNIVVTTRVNGLPGLAPDGPNTPSILGLDASYFSVKIGTKTATVLDAAYVGGLWELVVAAPVQAVDGLYDVTVNLCPGVAGGISDTEKNAVLYADITFHHAVVLDISGSMVYPTDAKLVAAKQAASFYIDSVHDNDKFTVVSFSGNGVECDPDATNLKGAAGLLTGSAANRNTMKSAVQALLPQDMTSIGDGLWTAQDSLDADATPGSIDTILLLTDGKENESRYWAKDPDGCGRVDTRILADETIVNTRAFGADAETDLCQQIAAQTGGDYLFNPVDDSSSSKPSKLAPTDEFKSLANRLTLQFFAGLESTEKLQRLNLERREIPGDGSVSIALPQPYDAVTRPLVYVGWSAPTTVNVSITDPDGNNLAGISKVYQDDTHIVFHPNSALVKGEYRISVDEKDGTPVEVFAGISGNPGNSLDFVCTLSPVTVGGLIGRPESPRELYEQGMPVDINLAAFDVGGRIRNLEVTVDVTMPNGEKACAMPLPMPDDGAHRDGNAADGRYGLRYTRTPYASNNLKQVDRGEKSQSPAGASGTYNVVIRAKGKDNLGQVVDRTFERSFQIYERYEYGKGKGDSDSDGMTDSWEVFYGTNPNVADDDKDPDMDGLRNIDEFFQGTHPHDPDTDNGGAADGYEFDHNFCLLNPADDPFPNLAPVSVITTSDSHGDTGNLKANALLLQFPDHPNYAQMEIYRGVVPGFEPDPSKLVKTLPMAGLVTSYYDKGLANMQPYYYKFRALSVDGSAATPFSREVTGVARTHPEEPFGSIVLNSAQEKTDRLQLAVRLLPRGSGTQYRLSDRPFAAGDPWHPLPAFGTIVPFTLTTPTTHGSIATVYFEFRSPSALVSRTYESVIRLDFTGDNDGDFLPDALDPDDDNDGVSDSDELFVYGSNPYSKDTDGDGYQDKDEINLGSDPTDFDSVPDADHDGYGNKLETLLASNPNDAASIPNIHLTIDISGGQTHVGFDTAAGVIYRLHSRSDLTNRVRDWPVVNGPLAGTGARRTVNAPIVEQRNFYGVSFELAPNP